MKASKWLWLAAFVICWLSLRVFWLDGDAGVPSLWEYGYNVTDEGYYMGAGKDKFLWGAFCDFTRNESFTYGYSPLTHWLSYAAYRIGGLSSWGFRIPFVALYLAAWVLSFLYVAKRCGEKTAFLWCAAFSAAPVMVVYERTACNDLAIAALGVIAFCIASGKGVWRIFAAAVVTGAISLVKPSVWVVLPIVAAGIISERKTRSSWLDVALFAVASVASVWLWKSVALLSLLPELGRHHLTAAEVLRRTTTHNPLPSLLDYDQLLRGFSSFPRDVCFRALSGIAVLVSAVPLVMAARGAIVRRWSWRIVLYLGILAYLAGISVNNSICLHYYHPVLLLLPILMCEVLQDFRTTGDGVGCSWKEATGAAVLLAASALVLLLFVVSPTVSPQQAIDYFSNISNLPRKIVWGFNGVWLLVVPFLVVAVLAFVRGLRVLKGEGVFWAMGGFVVASVAFSNLATPTVARYVHLNAADYVPVMGVTLVLGLLWLVVAFAIPKSLRCQVLVWFVPAALLLSFAVSPSWRAATAEMLRPAGHVQREVATEIVKVLPPNAVVLGERSSQVLMGAPYRTATTMPACNPIPIVKRLLDADAACPIYGLLDSQNAYNLQHFQKNQKEFQLQHIKTFKMPSFATGKPADVHFCRIIDRRPKAK